MKAFLTPRWIGLHLLLVVSVVAFARIGLWQWDRAEGSAGGWQNYGYALQWWLFAGFAVFLYVKTVLDELEPDGRQEPPTAPLPPVVQRQAPAPADDDDDELAAYNRYLRELHERSSREGQR